MPLVKFEDKVKKDEDTKPSLEKPTENRPNTMLRRSVSDLRQKSISARNFLKLLNKKRKIYRFTKEGLGDKEATDIVKHEMVDICDNKENIDICYVVGDVNNEERNQRNLVLL